MNNFLKTLGATSAAFALLASCNSSNEFLGTNKRVSSRAPSASEDGRGQTAYTPSNLPKTDGVGGTSPTQENPASQVLQEPCSKDRKILVVDLKSGWFAGDGGDFFKSVVDDSICGGAINIHYVHFTEEEVESNISIDNIAKCKKDRCSALRDIRSYDQFWLLSGDEKDYLDIRISGDLFKSIVSRARELRDANPNAGFYFGAGVGNIQHANALAKALFPQIAGTSKDLDEGLFAPIPKTLRGMLPQVSWAKETAKPLTAGNGTTAGTILVSEAPFKAFGPYTTPLSSLFDFQKKCRGDQLAPQGANLAGALFKLLGTDHCGAPMIGTFQVDQHAVMADGNTARHYGMPPTEYFQRIILALLR
jgi:hypothetical protein